MTALLGGSKEAPNKKDANIAPSFFSNALRGLGANVGWNSRTGTSAGVSYSLSGTSENGTTHSYGSIGLNVDGSGAHFTGDVDNTNLFTSSSDGSFRINTNFANDRLTNIAQNEAQEAFDAEMERRVKEAGDKLIRDRVNPPMNNDPDTMNPETRAKLLKQIGFSLAAEGQNEAHGTSERNPILGEISDGLNNLGAAFGLGNKASGRDGFVDADGNFHPRTCFVAGTLVTKLKIQYYDQARNGSLSPDKRYEEKVAIETIKAGDWVLSFDESKKEKSYKKVTDTFVRTTELIYTVSFVNGEKLETTWNHPFYILKKNQIRERAPPQLGASLFSAQFIDSTLTSPNSFGVGLSSERSPLRSGKGNGDYASRFDGEWISAKELKAGDVSLTASGKHLLIASIATSYKSETVYNFVVRYNHTYYVGVNGVLVHNQEKYSSQGKGGAFDILASDKEDFEYLKEKYPKEFAGLDIKALSEKGKKRLQDFQEGKKAGWKSGFGVGWISVLTPHIATSEETRIKKEMIENPSNSKHYKDGFEKTFGEGYAVGFGVVAVAGVSMAAATPGLTNNNGVGPVIKDNPRIDIGKNKIEIRTNYKEQVNPNVTIEGKSGKTIVTVKTDNGNTKTFTGPEIKGKPVKETISIKQRLPKTEGTWVNGTIGNGSWKSDKPEVNKITNNQPIEFKNGRPDLKPFSKGYVEIEKGKLNGTKNDKNVAINAFRIKLGLKTNQEVKDFIKENKYQIHHDALPQNPKTDRMDLIPADLHANLPHIGSASDMRNSKK